MQGIAVETPAARFIAEMVKAHPGEISILALGPLTNIALAMQYDAQLAPQLVRYIRMYYCQFETAVLQSMSMCMQLLCATVI